MFKKTIAAAALAMASITSMSAFATEVKSPMVDQEETVFDYSFFNTSINHSTKTDLTFLELEGGFGKGAFNMYGFIDIDEEGDTFTKLNPTFYFNDAVFANYTFKTFNADTAYHAGGIGYKWFDTDGHVTMAINAVSVGADGMFSSDEVGVGLHSTFNYALSKDKTWTVNGWADIDTFDNYSVFHGNAGVTKSFSNGLYGRVAYDWTQENVDVNDNLSAAAVADGIQFTAGYSW